MLPPWAKNLLFLVGEDGSKEPGWILSMFDAKWRPLVGDDIVDYLWNYHLFNRWSHTWSSPGVGSTTNGHERMHLHLKGQDNFNTVEGVGVVVHSMPSIGRNLSMWTDPFVKKPTVTAAVWKNAQALVESGFFNLGFSRKTNGTDLTLTPTLT
jgi:hypothetical protein